ncbi:MAG: serine hydrolase [Proteobacteria bacterium]|nr:serine hydrolase [Pseudomonadota bacterium]
MVNIFEELVTGGIVSPETLEDEPGRILGDYSGPVTSGTVVLDEKGNITQNLQNGINVEPAIEQPFHKTGSIAKTITSYLVHELESKESKESKEVGLPSIVINRKIHEYFSPEELVGLMPSFNGKAKELKKLGNHTLGDLLCHQTGLGDIGSYEDLVEKRTNGSYGHYKMLEGIEGTLGEPQYSNAGFELLGAIVEKATGKEMYELLHDNVFKPMGLTAAFPDKNGTLQEIGNSDGIKEFNTRKLNPTFMVIGDELLEKDNVSYYASGGLIMPPDQQAKLMHNIGNSEHIAKMTQEQLGDDQSFYGYGIGGVKVDGRIGKNGSVICARTEMWHRAPDNNGNGYTVISTATYVGEVGNNERHSRPDVAEALLERVRGKGLQPSPDVLRDVAGEMSRDGTIAELNAIIKEEKEKKQVKQLDALDLATMADLSPEVLREAKALGAEITAKPPLHGESKDMEEKNSWVDKSARTNKNNLTPGGARDI